VRIDAVEPSAAMAELGRRNLSGFEGVTFTNTEFERYPVAAEPYGLVYSAQAWHWIDRARRYELARAMLRPGGVLAAFWNRADWDETPLRDPFDAAYRRHAPELALDSPMRPPSTSVSGWSAWEAEIEVSAGLAHAEIRTYHWQTEYTSREYTELLSTHSDHALLAPERRAALLAEIEREIEARGGHFALAYVTRLCTARAV
jgi:SAM-dependent methyltransferase